MAADARRVPRKRVTVVGAGISGLAAARAFASHGHEVTVLERGRELGGVWAPSRSYPGVRTQSPKSLYHFIDEPMPAAYAEWPSGAEVHAYLDAWAGKHGLHGLIRYGRAVTTLERPASGRGWTVRSAGDDGATAEPADAVVVATGTYSQPNRPAIEGAERFREAGGAILHSSEWTDAATASGKEVVVVGFSKSATDVAVAASDAGARSVTVVYRRPVWRIPYKFGGALNFKHILYCRASEAMFPAWGLSGAGRLGHALGRPLFWANWRALETLLNAQLRLAKTGLKPAERIEDGVACGLSLATEGFAERVAEGRIRCVRGVVGRAESGRVFVGEEAIPADLVVQATGWLQDVPFLPADVRSKLVEPDGQWRLFRQIVNPDVADLGFVGFNSSFATTLSSDLAAEWLVRYLDGMLARQPTTETMRAEIDRVLHWRRTVRPAALGSGGNCVAPFHFRHFDELLGDIGVRSRRRNPLAELFTPPDGRAYARFLGTAPAYVAG